METLDVEGGADRPIELPISHGPATGYSWTLELPDGVRLLDAAPGPAVAPGREVGAPAAGNLRVVAPAGEHELIARFARPWEDKPLREVRLRLHVR